MRSKKSKRTSEVLRQRLVESARKYLGRPYKYGAQLYHAPAYFDCSSFVKFLYRKVGIDLPRPSIRMAEEGRIIQKKIKALQPGDLLYFRGMQGRYNQKFPQGIGHVAMYIGNAEAIHAKWKIGGGMVMEENTKKLLLRKDLIIIKRIL